MPTKCQELVFFIQSHILMKCKIYLNEENQTHDAKTHIMLFFVLLFALRFQIMQQSAPPGEIIVSELQVTAKIKEMQELTRATKYKLESRNLAALSFHQCCSSPLSSFEGESKNRR